MPVPESAAKAGKEIGGKGEVWLDLHLIRTDSPSLTRTHALVIVSVMLAQIHSVALRFIRIRSLPSRFKSNPEPPKFTQLCSVSLGFLEPNRFAQLHAISVRFAQTHKISLSLIQIRSVSSKPIQIP